MTSIAIGEEVVACGEVGLAGELRQVRATDRRLAEAARLGFRRAWCRNLPLRDPGNWSCSEQVPC